MYIDTLCLIELYLAFRDYLQISLLILLEFKGKSFILLKSSGSLMVSRGTGNK